MHMNLVLTAASRRLSVASLAAICLAASAQAGTVTLSEGDFAGWTATSLAGPDGVQTATVTTDGNPGDALTVANTALDLVITRFGGPGLSYAPAGGAILSVAYSLDFNVVVGNDTGMGVYALVLEQAGSTYAVDALFGTGSAPGWGNASGDGLTATDFIALDGGLGLDFSVAGAPIAIGFATENDGAIGTKVAFDNLSVALTTADAVAPLPAAAPLALAGFGALAFVGRRRRRG